MTTERGFIDSSESIHAVFALPRFRFAPGRRLRYFGELDWFWAGLGWAGRSGITYLAFELCNWEGGFSCEDVMVLAGWGYYRVPRFEVCSILAVS
jgi:hypothetical protein